MRHQRRRALLVLALLAAALLAAFGCDAERGVLDANLPPNTRISAGPPEATDTSYRVNINWFGWDDDGFVDHYEIAWEEPVDWIGPIFSNDSLFSVVASESCCVSQLPGQSNPSGERTYEQFHTFYVRSVDDKGIPDETPAVRSFNAKTIAPSTRIIPPSPGQLNRWGSRVVFYWEGSDDDGEVASYRYALTSVFDYQLDTGDPMPDTGELIAWLDTLTYYPEPGGGYFEDSLVWKSTVLDTVTFESVITTFGDPNAIIFGVRAVDNAGAEEVILSNDNVVIFEVDRLANGPNITVNSNIIGSWSSSTPQTPRGVFATSGLRFRWRAVPGPSQSAVAGFRYAVDDTSSWTAYSLNNDEFPVQTPEDGEDLWLPDGGPHSFFVQAIDRAGFTRVLPINLRVFEGPQFCPEEQRYVLVVTDTNPATLIQDSRVFPNGYNQVERGLIAYWFDGYDIVLHETNGTVPPEVSVMDCASSIFWFHSADTADPSILRMYHDTPPNVLPSYIASGGNLFLCGIQPMNAMRYFEGNDGMATFVQNTPVNFQATVPDTALVDHWLTTQFGIAQIEATVDVVDALDPSLRVAIARSMITTGPNPYPDLAFDPLSWPNGPQYRGFALYDRGIIPVIRSDSTQVSQPIYTASGGPVIGVRKLTSPGPQGNTVYVGFHPYFVDKTAFRQLLHAVLADFGEFPES
jgi:hypothetical protein